MVQNNFKQPSSLRPIPDCCPSTDLRSFCWLFCPIGLLVPSLWYSQKTRSLFVAPSAGYPEAFGPWALVLNVKRYRTVSERVLRWSLRSWKGRDLGGHLCWNLSTRLCPLLPRPWWCLQAQTKSRCHPLESKKWWCIDMRHAAYAVTFILWIDRTWKSIWPAW